MSFYALTSYARRRLTCLVVSMSPAHIGIFSLCTNTERISMKHGGGNHQVNWLHFGRNCTRDKAAGYDR